jgi:NitT/TauT family transport system ATP-binding protein
LRGSGKTVVFVTHHIDEAVYLADRVVVLTARPGRVLDSVAIDMPRPRSVIGAEFEAIARTSSTGFAPKSRRRSRSKSW